MNSESHTCSLSLGGVERTWLVPSLWDAVKALPVITVSINSLRGVFEEGSWLQAMPDLSSPVVEPELERIRSADLDYPIILHPNGWVMDGMHRIGKRLLAGELTIQAVQFDSNTLPDADIIRL